MKKINFKNIDISKITWNKYWTIGIIIIVILNIGYQWYITEKVNGLKDKLDDKNEELINQILDLETAILSTQEDNSLISESLQKTLEEAEKLSKDFRDVTENVEDLEKITLTDKELLQKYSKVYFLNEHYAPIDLEKIDTKWVYDDNKAYYIHEEVWPYLEKLLENAEDDGMDLQIISAFRSFDEQAQLKGAYTVQYGSGANTFSADQGYSEHQLGTTIDFTNSQVGSTFSGFAQTKEYQWLKDNAHKWGFVLSYPENNNYYQFEPWHWRFVGEKLADDLYDDEEYFYDLSQREIDEYIIYLFD